jgi:hypothetical protein
MLGIMQQPKRRRSICKTSPQFVIIKDGPRPCSKLFHESKHLCELEVCAARDCSISVVAYAYSDNMRR